MAKKSAHAAKQPLPISLQAEMQRGGQYCSHLVFSPDSQRLVACGNDRKIHLYDLTTNTRLACIQEHSSSIDAIAFSPDSQRFATISQRTNKRKSVGGELRVWRAIDGKLLKQTAIGPAVEDVEFLSLHFAPDGESLACALDDGEESLIAVLDSDSGKQANRFAIETNGQIALSSDGKTLAAGGEGQVLLLDYTSGKPRKVLRLTGRVRAVAYAPDSKVVAAVDKEYAVHLFSATTGKPLDSLADATLDVQHVQFSRDGKLIATIGVTMHGGSPAPIRIWDLKSKKLVAAFPGATGVEYPSGFPGACALSDDFKLFANAGTKTRVWQLTCS